MLKQQSLVLANRHPSGGLLRYRSVPAGHHAIRRGVWRRNCEDRVHQRLVHHRPRRRAVPGRAARAHTRGKSAPCQ